MSNCIALTGKKQACKGTNIELDFNVGDDEAIGLCKVHVTQLDKGKTVTVKFGLTAGKVSSRTELEEFMTVHEADFDAYTVARGDVKGKATTNNTNDSKEEPMEDTTSTTIRSSATRTPEFTIKCGGRYYRSVDDARNAKANFAPSNAKTGIACGNCSGWVEGKYVTVHHDTIADVKACYANREVS